MEETEKTLQVAEGQPKHTALVCIEDPKLLNRALSELDGVKFSAPFSVEDAVNRLKSSTYDLVLVSETFRAASRHENVVLLEISNLPEDRRREEFVVMVGPNLPTGDTLYAFAASVDAVVNTDDLSRIPSLFHEGRLLREQAYARFHAAARRLAG